MTTDHRDKTRKDTELRRLRKLVESIDENVRDILEKLSDHLDDLRYHRDWGHHGFDLSHDESDDTV